MASGKELSGTHTTPELNYQNWDKFHSQSNSKSLYSIDILLERPPRFKISSENEAKSVTESAELPERIRINSDSIIQLLRKLRPSGCSNDGPIILFRPYKILIFFDQEIRRSAMELEKADNISAKESQSTSPSDDKNAVQLSRLRCLIRFMDMHLSTRITIVQSPECNAIFFSDLWLLYKPGDFVVNRDILQVYRVMRIESKRKMVEIDDQIIMEEQSIAIHCVHIDFDGKWLGPVPKKFVIKKWGQLQHVGSLKLIPLTRAEAQKEHLRRDLVRRGQTFVQGARISPVNYSGYTLDRHMEINGTIVIDFEEALRNEEYFKGWRTTIEDYSEARMFAMGCDEHDDVEAHTSASKDGSPQDDSYVDAIRHQKFLSSQLTTEKSVDKIASITTLSRLLNQADPLTEDELLIMSHRVFGYTMDAAEWGVFDLSLASPMADRSNLQFDDLVIPSHIKELVKNLTTHHLKQMASITKPDRDSAATNHGGKGLVLILHGAAGVGKKTTAECIAKTAGAPLLKLSTVRNDVADYPSHQEMALPYVSGEYKTYIEKAFFWAKRWGCMVMIEQAETVLAWQSDFSPRAPWHDGHQIVFRKWVKRMLDTFTGITFLVTDYKPKQGPHANAVESSSLDIMSSVNASLLYPPLDKDQTVKIFELNMRWINNVFSKQHQDNPRPACLVMGEDILQFARAFYKQRQPEDRWNCRQIRNAFSTALALAHTDAEVSAERTDKGPEEPLKVTLKATHFEVFARSIVRPSSYQRAPNPPEPVQPLGQRQSQYAAGSQQRPQQRPQQQAPTQWNPSPSQQRQDQVAPPGSLVPNNRQLPPREYRGPVLPPPPPPLPPPPTYSIPPQPYSVPQPAMQQPEVDASGQMVKRRAKEFFLASPLSLDAKPELLFLGWDAFKDARAHKDDACSAIDVLVGEPVVSFDQEAQDSAWWSRWGERKRADGLKAKGDTNAAAVHRGKDLEATQPSQLPERIRIHSKYITAILEEIRGSSISKTSFVMVRPFKALTYYEDKIRAKHKKLATKFGGQPSSSEVEEGALKPESVDKSESSEDQLRLEKTEAVSDDHPPSREGSKPSKDVDDTSSVSSGSEDGEPVDTASHDAFQHLTCLVEFLDTIRARRQYLLNGSCSKVTFSDVWHLFKPGDEVLDKKQRQAYRILSVNSSGHRTLPPWRDLDAEELYGEEPVIILHSVHITFDGTMLGSIGKLFEIESFEGEEDVASLPVLPLRLVKDPDSEASTDGAAFRQDLIDRGRMFVRMARSTPMHYNGPLLHPKEEVDSQVVIDFEQAFAFWANVPNFRKPVIEKLIGKPIGVSLYETPCLASCCAGEQVHEDAYAEQKWNEAYVGTLIPDPQDRTKKPSLAIYPRAIRGKTFDEAELTDEDLVIMSYKVCGFVLRNRKWAQMDLKYLSPLNSGGRIRQVSDVMPAGGNAAKTTNETAETTLDQLVLPPGHKNIVKSLISQHFQDKNTGRYEAEEKDVVRGKGKGLIILLHGAPGVGKTSTAEGVAEAFNKPLFQITSGDLGTNARELEDALEWHFYLAHKWDCVLLLDEADVFLSVRSPEDFQRNSLVAVFLRVLEYYAGVLFLTTNRIGDFDEAFSSRIHISLYYPPLKRISTKKIFDLNLRNIQQRIEERGVEIEVEHDQILSWAVDYWKRNKKMRWNGRQIRNACQTALALAEYDAQHPAGSTPDESAVQLGGGVEKSAKIKLTIDHLETVAKAYLEFMRYLHEIYGKDAERRAKAMGIRAREFSMKNWAAAQEPPPEEDDDEESEDDTRGTETAQNKSGQALDKGKATPEASVPSMAQQNNPFPTAPFPYPTFPMPNMPNPYGLQVPFGQTQQPQAMPYQQTADQQRQYLASMAAWQNMMPGGQQVPFPGMPGMPAQPPGGTQSQGGSQMQGGSPYPSGAGT